MSTTSGTTVLMPFQPSPMTYAQLAAVSHLTRYVGPTHVLYAAQLRRWFGWCEANELGPLVGIQRAHVELYIRQLGEPGLMDSSVNTMMHGVRGFSFRAHRRADPGRPRRSPPGYRGSTRTRPAPRAWTGSS